MKTLFTIHLIEDDTGHVKVVAEAVGLGVNAHELGYEILHNLKLAERDNPECLTVAPFTYSEFRN